MLVNNTNNMFKQDSCGVFIQLQNIMFFIDAYEVLSKFYFPK